MRGLCTTSHLFSTTFVIPPHCALLDFLKSAAERSRNIYGISKASLDMFIWQIHKNKMQTNAQRVTAMGAKRTEGLDFIPGEISAISGSTPSKTAYFCHHSLEKRCFVRFDFINLQFRQAPMEGERFWLLDSV